MGYGHGIYVPVALFSSPLGYFGIRIAFYGTTLLWGFIGYCVSSQNISIFIISVFLLLIHYISFPIISIYINNFNDWYNFSNTLLMNEMTIYLVFGLFIYLSGQLYLVHIMVNKLKSIF
jgi:hypothetical protein